MNSGSVHGARARVFLNRAIGDAATGRGADALGSCYQSLEAGHKHVIEAVMPRLGPEARSSALKRIAEALEFNDFPLEMAAKLNLDQLSRAMGSKFTVAPGKETYLRKFAVQVFPPPVGVTDFFERKMTQTVAEHRNMVDGHDNPSKDDPALPAEVSIADVIDALTATAGFLRQSQIIKDDEVQATRRLKRFQEEVPEKALEILEDPVAAIPRATYSAFVGSSRQADVERVIQKLEDWPVVSVVGIGGLGKTAVAREAIVQCLTRSSRFERVTWISCKATEYGPLGERGLSPDATSIEDIAELVLGPGLSESKLELGHITQAVEPAVATLRRERHLVVLDSLEDLRDSRIEEFIGALSRGVRLLVTSRSHLVQSALVQLEPMRELDLRSIVLNESTARGLGVSSREHEKIADRIASESRGIPLVTRAMLWRLESGAPLDNVSEEFKSLPGDGVDNYCYGKIVQSLSEPQQLALLAIAQLGGKADFRFLRELLDTNSDGVGDTLESLERHSLARRPKVTVRGEEVIVSIDAGILGYAKLRLEQEPALRVEIQSAMEQYLNARAEEDKLASGLGSPHESLALTLFLPGAGFPGEEKIREYREGRPKDPYIFYHWADYLQRAQRDDRAAASVLEKGLEEFPENYFLNKRRGILAKGAGEILLATRHLEKAREVAGERYRHAVPLGQAYVRAGRFDEAFREFESVLEADSATPTNLQYALAGAAEATFRFLLNLRPGQERDGWDQVNLLEYWLLKTPVEPNEYVLRWLVPAFARGGVMMCADGQPRGGHTLIGQAVDVARRVRFVMAPEELSAARAHLASCRKR